MWLVANDKVPTVEARLMAAHILVFAAQPSPSLLVEILTSFQQSLEVKYPQNSHDCFYSVNIRQHPWRNHPRGGETPQVWRI